MPHAWSGTGGNVRRFVQQQLCALDARKQAFFVSEPCKEGESMQIVRFNEVREYETSEGILKPLFVSEELKMIHLKIPAGLKEIPHPHRIPENVLVTKGSVRLNADTSVLLQEGDMVHIPAHCTAGLESEGEAEVLLVSFISKPTEGKEIPERPCPVVRCTIRSVRSPGNTASGL